MTVTSKLPASAVPLIRDPDLTRELEALLKPYSGKRLERAQAAVKRVLDSGMSGAFGALVATYRTAVLDAVGADD